MSALKIWLYTDGGAKPNPGHGAIAFIIADEQGRDLEFGGTCVGHVTSNVAEYLALIRGLAACPREAQVHWVSDSQVAVRQMSNAYRVEDEKLIPLHTLAIHLSRQFAGFHAEDRRRKDPALKRVDAMVNQVRDAALRLGTAVGRGKSGQRERGPEPDTA